ncbi:MAG TPA: RES family NAD+ phosphorylase [Egibacteraceae bacterium]|nr:RES family NAD+ phosphorylase [Egibacteraceae bacterium]
MPILHAWRLAAWDTPLWVNPNRSEGRFNADGAGPVQYWCLHPLTPWAEHLRAHGIDSPERLGHLRLRLWVARFDVDPAVVGFSDASRHRLDPDDLVGDDHAACQGLGARCLAGDGPAIIEVPSAALPGTRNLVLFGPRVAAPFSAEPVDGVDIPATVAAEGAHPLIGLLGSVRHRGQPHAELDAWRRGARFRFAEPATPLA